MTEDTSRNKFRELGLLPYQADFAVKVLTQKAPSLMVLQGPVGSGMTHTICHAIGEGIKSRVFRRVLYLTPSASWTHATRFQDFIPESQVEHVDRKVLREFEAVAPVDGDIWPQQGVFVACLDFAKRPEVSSLFTDAVWDIVVIDEAHRVVNPSIRREFVKALLNKDVSHAVFAYHVSVDKMDEVLSQLDTSRAISKTVWKRHELMNWEEELLPQKTVTWETIRYHMNEGEAAFLQVFEETARATDLFMHGNSLVQQSLMKRATSCLYSVEQALMDLARKVHRRRGCLSDIEDEIGQDALLDDSPEQSIKHEDSEYCRLKDRLDKTLMRFEDLETDSKSEAAIRVLMELPELNVCVVSQYETTVSYLYSVFSEEESMNPIMLTGRMSSSETESQLSQYRSHGGLLLATDAGLRDFAFLDVDVVLHYDLPWSPERVDFRVGRFDRMGRQGILRMICLVEENAVTTKLWDKRLSIAKDLDSGDAS